MKKPLWEYSYYFSVLRAKLNTMKPSVRPGRALPLVPLLWERTFCKFSRECGLVALMKTKPCLLVTFLPPLLFFDLA